MWVKPFEKDDRYIAVSIDALLHSTPAVDPKSLNHRPAGTLAQPPTPDPDAASAKPTAEDITVLHPSTTASIVAVADPTGGAAEQAYLDKWYQLRKHLNSAGLTTACCKLHPLVCNKVAVLSR